jgi:hypothetical protein
MRGTTSATPEAATGQECNMRDAAASIFWKETSRRKGETFGYTSRWVARTMPDNRIVRVCGVSHHAATGSWWAARGAAAVHRAEPTASKHHGGGSEQTTIARSAVWKKKWSNQASCNEPVRPLDIQYRGVGGVCSRAGAVFVAPCQAVAQF